MCFPCPPSSLLFCNRAHASAHSLNPLESAQPDKGSLRGHTYTYAHAWICFCVALGISEPPRSKLLPYLSHTSLQNPDIRWFCCLQYLETNHSYIAFNPLHTVQLFSQLSHQLVRRLKHTKIATATKESHKEERERERERGENTRNCRAAPPPPPQHSLL